LHAKQAQLVQDDIGYVVVLAINCSGHLWGNSSNE